MRELYIKGINDLLEKMPHSKKIFLFFKGFPVEFYSCLRDFQDVELTEQSFLLSNGYIDIKKLETRPAKATMSIVGDSNNIAFRFYEELTFLSNTVGDVSAELQGDIVVVDNNLFSQFYSLPLEKKLLERLITEYNSECYIVSEEYTIYSKYYSGFKRLGEGIYTASFINSHKDHGIKVIPFYPVSETCFQMTYCKDNTIINVKDEEFITFKFSIQKEGPVQQTTFVIDSEGEKKELVTLSYIHNFYGIQFSIKLRDRFEGVRRSDNSKYLGILKKYWGNNAEFREMHFYENPDVTKTTSIITQGDIVSQIIEQCEIAISRKNDYKNFFVTAPTGSGKSMLFQLPAVYLSEKHSSVTIIVTPLKALMLDQVSQLQNERGISCATYINSDISFDEKENRIAGLKSGKYSILYIAPEYLLSTNIESVIGNRILGLLVVDEAHIVSTWGKEFRIDYWYLGEYLNSLRISGKKFPVLCITATAVYGGPEDMVNDIIQSLHLSNTVVYIGNVKKENIGFDIQAVSNEALTVGHDTFKINVTVKRIVEFIESNRKSIVYCPFKTIINKIHRALPIEYRDRVGLYYNGLEERQKIEAYENFKNGNILVMVCTTAFGMGVDVKDIEVVYHTAPVSGLVGYVQEIGRAARELQNSGYAKIDYTNRDIRYLRTLHGLSGIKQYQAREILKKLLVLYEEKSSENLLVSPETFSYLFDEKDLENRVKSALLLISKDLELKYSSNVLSVRPKSMFTTNYVNVPEDVEKYFLANYGDFVQVNNDFTERVQIVNNRMASDVTITNYGNIYKVQMADLWEKKFKNLSFGEFKRQFFSGKLMIENLNSNISPRLCLTIKYFESFDKVRGQIIEISKKLIAIFDKYKRDQHRFTSHEFKEKVKNKLMLEERGVSLSGLLLELFIGKFDANNVFENYDKLKFIAEERKTDGNTTTYRIMNKNYMGLKTNLLNFVNQCTPNTGSNTCTLYLPISKRNTLLSLCAILEIFELAACEIVGGKNTEIFVRVNDPVKLRRLAQQKYSNLLITKIEKQKKISEKTIHQFLTNKTEDKQRWDFIEDYFLGRITGIDDYIEEG